MNCHQPSVPNLWVPEAVVAVAELSAVKFESEFEGSRGPLIESQAGTSVVLPMSGTPRSGAAKLKPVFEKLEAVLKKPDAVFEKLEAVFGGLEAEAMRKRGGGTVFER